MPSDQTKTRILDAADKLFALEGYVATSHRRVADAAGVNLAAIRYHYGHKKAMFQAVIERHLRPLDKIRIGRLEELEKSSKKRPPRVEELVAALVEPLFALAKRPDNGPRVLQLLARARIEPGEHWDVAVRIQQETFGHFQTAFQKACPRLRPRTIAFRLSFYLGSIAIAIIDEPTIKAAGGRMCDLVPVLPRLQKRLARLFIAGLKVPEGS